MRKKIIFSLIFILLLVIIAGGFFWWQIDEIERFLERRVMERMVAPSKDYAVVEELGEKFIVNRKDGFQAKIPSEWEVLLGDNGEILESDREVTLYSKEFSYRPPKGCLINIQINRAKRMPVKEYDGDIVMFPFEGVEDVKEEINTYKKAMLQEKEKMKERWARPEIIFVDQKETLRETIILSKNIGKFITIKAPTDNRLYIFRNIQFSEYCDEELQQFLETVSIK
mgnify:CR=1 FL=1